MRKGSGTGGWRRRSFPRWLLIALLGNVTCKESLSPFVDPKNLFVASAAASYVLTVNENSLHVSIRVENKYEETLQAVTDPAGSVEITLIGHPGVKATVPITAANLFTSGKYNPGTRVLTVDPGDVLRFDVTWSFLDDSGLSIADSFFRYYKDPDCRYRCIAEEEVFEITGSMTLFEHIQVANADPIRLSVCHVSSWVDGAICQPVITAVPCSKRPPEVNPVLCDTTAF